MSDVETARTLLVQLGVLVLMACGVLLMLSGFSRRLRSWAGRAALLALLFIVVSAMVTPEWLP